MAKFSRSSFTIDVISYTFQPTVMGAVTITVILFLVFGIIKYRLTTPNEEDFPFMELLIHP